MPSIDPHLNPTDPTPCDVCSAQVTELWAVDDDEMEPWVCADCYDNRDDLDLSSPNPFQESMTPRTGARGMQETPDLGNDHTPTVTGVDLDNCDGRLRLPAFPTRPTRVMSVELEVGQGRTSLPRAFYNYGLSRYNNLRGYHGSEHVLATDSGQFVHVEQDSSVDAEIVCSMMDLDNDTISRRFEQAMRIVRAGVQANEVQLDARCGMHIHVDLTRVGLGKVANLYHLWNFMEDTIFRVASANWQGHRTEVASTNYAPRVGKGFRSRREIVNNTGGRNSMSLGNYFRSMRSCQCGVVQYEPEENWGECRCHWGKATVEFRVFNTTANLRKIHAYTALALALVTHAINSEELSPDDLPVMEWTGTNHQSSREDTEQRVRYMLNELPLTTTEREDLIYCMRNSSIKDILGWSTQAEYENLIETPALDAETASV